MAYGARLIRRADARVLRHDSAYRGLALALAATPYPPGIAPEGESNVFGTLHRQTWNSVLAAVALLALPLACDIAQARDVRIQVTDPQGRALANAAVALRWDGAPPPQDDPPPAVMSQREMTFIPHVLAIPVHTSVTFPNYDPTRHHVYSFSQAKTFDIKLYVGFPQRPEYFDTPGVVSIGCNIHDQMQAFIVVMDAPRIAVTDSAGQALLTEVPDVPREVEIWHEWLSHGQTAVVRAMPADTDFMHVPIDIAPPPAPARPDGTSLQERFNRIAQ